MTTIKIRKVKMKTINFTIEIVDRADFSVPERYKEAVEDYTIAARVANVNQLLYKINLRQGNLMEIRSEILKILEGK